LLQSKRKLLPITDYVKTEDTKSFLNYSERVKLTPKKFLYSANFEPVEQ
jgi:hypothetical protein